MASSLASSLRIVTGNAHPDLARAVAALLGAPPPPDPAERFPDGELRPDVGRVQGADVYVLQPTGPPVHDNLVELLLMLDASRRAGAGRVTAVVPYLAYARQERRTSPGHGIGLRVVADALAAAGAQRLVVVDPHTAGFEASFALPVLSLTACALLVEGLTQLPAPPEVVVAPDLGALPLAEHLARCLGGPSALPVAVVRKTRISGAHVRAEMLIGTVGDRRAVIVDDMITTGATIEAAVAALHHRGATHPPVVAATHALLVGSAADRLAGLGIASLLVTDTVPAPTRLPATAVLSVAPLVADAVGRLHRDEPVDDLSAFP